MTDPANGSKLIEEAGRQWKLLSPSDYIRLGNELKASRRKGILANCRDAGLDAEATFKRLGEHDARAVSRDDVLDYGVDDVEGRASSVLLSYRKEKPDATLAEVDALGLTPAEVHRIAAKVHHLEVRPAPPNPPEGAGADPPPTASGSAAVAATGDAT